MCLFEGMTNCEVQRHLIIWDLYKAKAQTLARDQSDFDLALPRMTLEARAWLLRHLEKRFPEGHAWITILRGIIVQQPGRGDAADSAPHPER